MRVTSRPASTRLAAMQLPLAPVPKTAIFRDMAAPLEQRDMPYLNRQSRWMLNQHVVAAERELVQRLLASTEMAKFAASGGSGDGLNLGERSGRLALAN